MLGSVGPRGTGLYCVDPMTGKVFDDERIHYELMRRRGFVNDKYDGNGFAVGKWERRATALEIGSADAQEQHFVPRLSAELAAGLSARDSARQAFVEHTNNPGSTAPLCDDGRVELHAPTSC